MKKLILSSLLFGSLAMAQTYYDILPYGGYINYSGTTTKDSGYVSGVYFSAFSSPWKTEMDMEHTQIDYTDNTPSLKQNDFSMFLNYYEGYDLQYSFGIHYIDSTDDLTDSGQVYKFGILCYKTYAWNRGVDIYYSNYSNLNTSPKLLQISPKAGINFGDYYSIIGSFYAEIKMDYIKVLKNQRINDLDSVYKSVDFTLNNYNSKFITSLNMWFGKRAYAVENGGFIVNNIGDEQNEGLKISEEYKIDTYSSIKFAYSYTKFKENGNSSSRTYLLSYNYNF